MAYVTYNKVSKIVVVLKPKIKEDHVIMEVVNA